MDPMTMAALASAAGSLFNKKPSYDPNQRRMMEIAQQLQSLGQGVPFSDPAEQAALAQQRGMLGNEQQMATGQVLGALPGGARTNVADLMKNLSGSQASERGSLDLMALMESLNRRRQALMQSAQVYGSVGPKQGGHQSELPAMIGQLAYQQAMQKAMRPPGGQQQPGAQNTGLLRPQLPTSNAGAPAFPWGGGAAKPAAPVAAQSQPAGGNLLGGLMGGAMQRPAPAGRMLGAGNEQPFQQTLAAGSAQPSWPTPVEWPVNNGGGDMLSQLLRKRTGG